MAKTHLGEANNESDGRVSSLKSVLGSLTNEQIKPCSIFGVPEQLRKSKKETEVYKPKVVSIGPLHRGTKRDLQYMEEIKYRCMLSLFLRTDKQVERFAKCSKAIRGLDETIRVFYIDDIELNNDALAKIMLLDGCFLLELLISNAEQEGHVIQNLTRLDLDIKSLASESDAARRVRKNGEVLSDLKLIENQIPLLVLIWLFHLLFPKESDITKTYEPIRNTVNGLALFLFGCSPSPDVACSQNRAHFVDLVHAFLTEKEDETGHLSISIETSERNSVKRNYDTTPKLKCCAARLKAAGIAITPCGEQREVVKLGNDGVIFGCYKSFRAQDNKLLEIHALNITEETEILWRNLIAWEQNRLTREKYLAGKHDLTSCKFSEFALLFRDLVCCEHDVEVLKRRKVVLVTNEKKWSNEKLMTLFHTLADRIQIDVSEDFEYGGMVRALNEYSGAGGGFAICRHICRRVLTNAWYTLRTWFATLKRDHTPTVWKTIGVLAAVVLLLLTVAQTVLAAIGL